MIRNKDGEVKLNLKLVMSESEYLEVVRVARRFGMTNIDQFVKYSMHIVKSYGNSPIGSANMALQKVRIVALRTCNICNQTFKTKRKMKTHRDKAHSY
jgi:hypothetical protein